MSRETPDVFEWHIVERIAPERNLGAQKPLQMGPFASETECRMLLRSLNQIPRFNGSSLDVQKRYKRREKRIKTDLMVQVSRLSAPEQSWLTRTVDVSVLGSRLTGLGEKLQLAELVEIRNKQRAAIFRVAWLGVPNAAGEAQTGVECLNPENNIWGLDLADHAEDDPWLREIAVARTVQDNLMPQHRPQLETLDYSGSCIQAQSVGGDYYDFLDLGAGQVGFVLADISGKGVPAALLMANLQGSLHTAGPLDVDNLPKLLAQVNRHLYDHTDAGRYATFFFGCYRDDTRKLNYVNCGHNPPLLLRETGSIDRLSATATVLGMFEDWECCMGETRLEEGDLLTIFTDGVTETRGETGEEFGEERLLQTLHESRHLASASILSSVEEAVGRFRHGVQPEDDVTLVVARAQ